MEYEIFSDYLEVIFLNIEEDNGKKFNLTSKANLPFKNESEYAKYDFPKEFFEVYENSNGIELKWKDDNKPEYNGELNFLNVKDIIASNNFFDENDIVNNDLLNYFYAFDVTSDYECGFMITPEETYKSIYYRRNFTTSNLELDFLGYVTMLYHSRAYQNWQTVILDILNNEESQITKDFKECMTYLDKEFSFDEYVSVFNGLRIIN